MSELSDEIDVNAAKFRERWQADLEKNLGSLKGDARLLSSYRRIAALQALKSSLIEKKFSPDAQNFFAEGQNDALTSHVLASFGAWRSALQALRSCIENVLSALYYNDHPVEMSLWLTGAHRLGFSELHSYFCKHPKISAIPIADSGLEILHSEYATLSRAVHGSATSFRMTDPAAKLLLWSDAAAKMGMWSAREAKVIEGLCLLTSYMLVDHLTGTSLPAVRETLGFAISSSKRAKLKIRHIHIDTPG